MPSEMEFVNFKDFVDSLPAADDFADGDKSVLSGAMLRKMDKDVLLEKNAEGTLTGINGILSSVDASIDVGVYIGGIDDSGNPEDWNNARVGRYDTYNRVFVNSDDYEIRPSYYTAKSNPWSTDFVGSGLWGKNCYNDGSLFMAVSIRRTDGTSIQNSELETIKSCLFFYKFVDDSLSLSGVPADSKECGERFKNVNLKINDVGKNELLNAVEIDAGKQVNYSDGQVVESTTANISCMFEVNFPALLLVSGRIGTDSTMCGVAFYNSNNEFITALKKSGGASEIFSDYLVVVPKGTKYIRVQGHGVYMPSPSVREVAGLFVLNRTCFSGKKLSLLGDSISAYSGTIPSGNAPYYTGSNSGVTSYHQMWWKIVCDLLDMDPLIINGWSGSCVTEGVRTDTTCASDLSRCQGLDDGANNPDVIIVAMGVNDYSYNAPLGTWAGRSDASDNLTYSEAYAFMLKKIMEKYPNAEILCLSPWFMQRGTDNGTTYTNTSGLCVRDYAESAKKVCEIMGVKWFDADSIGFNRNNYYPTYCVDSSSKPTHPNLEGQKMMGICVARALASTVCKLM